MAKIPRQQDALLRYLDPESGEDVAVPYGGGRAPQGPLADRIQTAGRPGRVTQLPGNGGAIVDTAISGGAALAPTIAGALTKAPLVAHSIPGASVGAGAAKAGLGGAATLGIGAAGEIGGALLKRKEQMPTYGGEFGDITDDYGRRFESNGGGVASNAATWAGRGATAGSVIPGVGTAIGAGVGALGGAIKGLATKNADSAFSDFRKEDASDAITKGYEQFLGRPPEEGVIDSRLTGQGLKPGDRWVGEQSLFNQLSSIKNSPEAQARAAGTTDAGGGVANALAGLLADNPNAPANGGGVRGGTGASAAGVVGDPNAWDTDGYAAPQYTANVSGKPPDGYEEKKWNNPNHQTPKYVVARLQTEAGGDKAKFAELLSKAYPGATFDGKDKISGIPGIGTVDIYRGASVGENGIVWQPLDEQGGGASALASSAGGGPSTPQLDGLGNGSLEAILAALGQIATGPNDPKTLQASLLRQLTNAGAA